MPSIYDEFFGAPSNPNPRPRPPAWMGDFFRLSPEQQLASVNLLPASMRNQLEDYLLNERGSRAPIEEEPLDLSDDGSYEYKEAS